MKKNLSPNRSSGLLMALTALLMIFVQGCKSDEMKEQILLLSQKQTLLTGEKDSLLRLLESKRVDFDTLFTGYNTLTDQNKALSTKVKSLQSGYYSRGNELKKAAAEKSELTKSIAVKDSANNSLQKEVVVLGDRIAQLDRDLAAAGQSKDLLEAKLAEKQDKIEADSLAEVERLNKPVIKESGYVNITGVGAGFGLGETNVDYSKSLISIDNIFGYKINRQFTTGIGAGVHIYNGGTVVPLFIDMRYFFKRTGNGLFLVADGGYLLNPSDFGTSHVFVNPALGVSKVIKPHAQLNLSAGILTMQAPTSVRSTFFTIKAGIAFTCKNGPSFRIEE